MSRMLFHGGNNFRGLDKAINMIVEDDDDDDDYVEYE